MSSVPFDETLIAPIGGDAQVGRDLSYEPAFQALQAEVDQATALAGRMVNWQLVHQETARMLREDSKDLRLASWWFVATAHLEGWPGLARALGFYQSMLEAHWDGMFPTAKRARARAGLVQWVWEGSRKISQWLNDAWVSGVGTTSQTRTTPLGFATRFISRSADAGSRK